MVAGRQGQDGSGFEGAIAAACRDDIAAFTTMFEQGIQLYYPFLSEPLHLAVIQRLVQVA